MSSLCLVCVSLRSGGTERIVSSVANYFSEKFEVSLLVLSRSEPFYSLRSEVRLLQPEVRPRSQSGWHWYIRILGHLRRSLVKAHPDLVLCFGEHIAPVVLPMARLTGSRVLVFNRASPVTSLRGRRGFLNPLIYPLAHRVVVQTDAAARLMKSRYPFSRFEVWPNPVEVPAQVAPIKMRHRRIINVGTMGGQKNQQTLLRAFASLENRDVWTLDLVGDGPDRVALERLSEELDISESVRFHGQTQNVDGLLQGARIFAFTSLTEGFPNALAEALAAGCACISYDCPTGPSDLIEDQVNGLLVPNGDQNAFTGSLRRLVTDYALQERLASSAREKIAKFSAGNILVELDRLVGRSLAT